MVCWWLNKLNVSWRIGKFCTIQKLESPWFKVYTKKSTNQGKKKSSCMQCGIWVWVWLRAKESAVCWFWSFSQYLVVANILSWMPYTSRANYQTRYVMKTFSDFSTSKHIDTLQCLNPNGLIFFNFCLETLECGSWSEIHCNMTHTNNYSSVYDHINANKNHIKTILKVTRNF